MNRGNMKRNILLVDDDILVLKALKRSLRKFKDQCNVLYAQSAQEALDQLGQDPIDVLITEVRLITGDCEIFLRSFLKRHPGAARIVLTGYTASDAIFKFAGLAHQLLAKPWSDQTLIETIQRADLISRMLSDERLKQRLHQIENFPSIPSVYTELTQKLNDSAASMEEIGAIIIRDPSLTIKLLQIVNSPYYGLPMPVTDPLKAVNLLGLDIVKGFVLTSGIFKQYEQSSMAGLQIDALWQHSLKSANIVRQIAKREHVEKDVGEASFIASLLHDVGKIIIASNFPDEYKEICSNSASDNLFGWQAEQAVLGVSHAEIGAYLLGLWGLPLTIVKAVQEHHQPKPDEHTQIDQTVLVHIANAIENNSVNTTASPIADLNLEFMDRLHLSDRVMQWQQEIRSMG
jgi:putative nucleotidyltransferase with HDIG domain